MSPKPLWVQVLTMTTVKATWSKVKSMDPNGVSWGVSLAFTSPTIIQIQQSIEGLSVSNTINFLR